VSLVAESRRWGGELARLIARQRDPLHAEYGFLLGRYIDQATLARAQAIARRWDVHPHEVLIANGWLDTEDYYQALAERCGAPFKAKLPAAEVEPTGPTNPRQCLAKSLLKERMRARSFVFAPDRLRPNALREMLRRLSPYDFSLASPHAVRSAICRHFAPVIARQAVEGLAARHPGMSAKERPAKWQRRALLLGAMATVIALALAPVKTIWVMTLGLALLFVPVIAFRLLAVYGLLRSATASDSVPRVPDHALPIYTVLVPLYREAHMLPSLVQSLRCLDYPAAKLDIKLILESNDIATIAAARALYLPGNFEVIVVPECQPRTKPKALNYALPLARGEYVVIYDAEDRPEPGQLRQAAQSL
jgi:hypothetical protein